MEPAPEPLPKLTRGARALGLLGLEAASVGLTMWILFSRGAMPEYVHDNTLGVAQRRYVLIDMGVAVAVAALVVLALFVRKRGAALPLVERIARRLAPVALVWFVPLVFDHRLWVDQDLLVLPLVVLFGWGLVAALRTSLGIDAPWLARFRSLDAQGPFARLWAVLARPRTPLVVVTCLAAAYGVYFSAFTITNHENLGTHAYDLGIFDNLMWHVVHPELPLFRSTPAVGPTGTHFGRHATLFAYVIAPLYAIAPRAETLLVIQAALVGAAAIPLYLYASRHVPPWTAALVASAYLFYPPLHGANLYDFHFLTVGTLFLWLALYAVEQKRLWLTVLAVVASLAMREDVAALLAVLGLYLLLTGAAARAGAVLATVGGAYFLLMKLVLMPILGHTDGSFLNQYTGLLPGDESGFGGVVKTLLANPVFTSNVIFERDKVTYLLELLAPLLLLPVMRPIGALLVVPGLVFTLLSTGYWPLYQPTFQYTAYWTPFAFLGVVYVIEHTGKARFAGDTGGPLRRRSLVLGLAAASLACTYLNGGILRRTDVRAGFTRVSFRTTEADRERRADLAALIAQIPRDGKVVASDRLVPHISNRDAAYSLTQGVFNAEWLLAETEQGGDDRRALQEILFGQTFGVVEIRGSILLAKRGASPASNVAVLLRM